MTDVVDPGTRSRMMSGIRGKDTRPERIVRSGLHRLGFRFRLHVQKLPGSPDLVLKRHSAVIFVHGCYWHRHQGCRYATTPATRREFWLEKFQSNVDRDRRNRQELQGRGWRVFVVWECALRKEPVPTVSRLGEMICDKKLTGSELPDPGEGEMAGNE